MASRKNDRIDAFFEEINNEKQRTKEKIELL